MGINYREHGKLATMHDATRYVKWVSYLDPATKQKKTLFAVLATSRFCKIQWHATRNIWMDMEAGKCR